MPQRRTHYSIGCLKHLVWNIVAGLRSKYPPCCIINYSMDEFIYKMDAHKRYIRGIGRGGYEPCKLCFRARKQTHKRAVTALFLDSGYLEDCDYQFLPEKVKLLVFNPPIS